MVSTAPRHGFMVSTASGLLRSPAAPRNDGFGRAPRNDGFGRAPRNERVGAAPRNNGKGTPPGNDEFGEFSKACAMPYSALCINKRRKFFCRYRALF